MSRFKKMLKWSLISLLGLGLALFAFGYWFMSLIPEADADLDPDQVVATSIPYLNENIVEPRGKVLAVVTSTDQMGASGKKTGYELTELSRAYYVFTANGFEVDVASPQGGQPPVIIDDEDMGAYDFAFLNDSIAQEKTKNTLPLSEVDPTAYEAVYFVGGKGAMYDFPDNPYIQSLVRDYYQSGKVVGAVCHGPAALVNVTLTSGDYLLQDKAVSSFTNNEELFLIPDAEAIFPFLLEDQLVAHGAKFIEGSMYLEHVAVDQNIVTGQNPWSTWHLAETMIRQMGYQPKERVITAEENAVKVLSRYEEEGFSGAQATLVEIVEGHLEMNRTLIAMHSIVSAMQGKIGKTFQLIRLLKDAKDLQEA
ncbi:MAG: type 1 glutamine amidotransferase domain-containing protein [Bacteroidota bacterium]